MIREMLQAKLHRGAVTGCELDYPGSLTVDLALLEAAGILVHQKVQVVNINNGNRFETYVIAGDRGKSEIVINGAAARLAYRGDRIIVIAFCLLTEAECTGHHPRVVQLDERNRITGIL